MSDERFRREAVLPWVQIRDHEASEILSVTPDGTDWDGDTEGGFHSSFDLEIRYRRSDGSKHRLNIDGADTESLWRHVTNSWPTP